jgi:hypothetical protein
MAGKIAGSMVAPERNRASGQAAGALAGGLLAGENVYHVCGGFLGAVRGALRRGPGLDGS